MNGEYNDGRDQIGTNTTTSPIKIRFNNSPFTLFYASNKCIQVWNYINDDRMFILGWNIHAYSKQTQKTLNLATDFNGSNKTLNWHYHTKHSNHALYFISKMSDSRQSQRDIHLYNSRAKNWRSIKLNSEQEIPPAVSLSLSVSPPPPPNEKHGSIFGIWINIGEYGGNVVWSFFLCILFIVTKDTRNQTRCS